MKCSEATVNVELPPNHAGQFCIYIYILYNLFVIFSIDKSQVICSSAKPVSFPITMNNNLQYHHTSIPYTAVEPKSLICNCARLSYIFLFSRGKGLVSPNRCSPEISIGYIPSYNNEHNQ